MSGAGSEAGWPVGSAFSLGWLMAQFYGPLPHRQGGGTLGHLPTVSELSDDDQMSLAFAQLDNLLGPSGLSSTDITTAWKAADHEGFGPAVGALHFQILDKLILQYEQLNAYQLGRALSDTCWLPDEKKGPAFFARQFDRHRLATLQSWLVAAGSALPSQEAATVSRSLQNWQDWADANASQVSTGWATAHWSVVAALRAQASAWHALLAGEATATSQPSVDAWIQGGESIVRTTRQLTAAILRRFWPVVIVMAAATGGLLYLAIADSHGTAKVWTSLVTVAAALGVSGASVRSAAAKVASGLRQDIWTAASLDARAWEATWLPALPQGPLRRHRLATYGVAVPQTRSRLEGLAAKDQPAQQPALSA